MAEEVTSGLPTEQSSVEAPVESSAPEQPSSFFDWTDPTGKQVSFSSPDELSNAMRDSYLRREDYTRKTQELSSKQKEYEKRQADFEDQMREFTKRKSQYDEWDNLLKTRPQVHQQLMRLVNSPASPGETFDRAKEYADEQLTSIRKELEDFKKYKEQQELEGRRNAAFENLGKKYGDIDRNALEERLSMLKGGDIESLYEMLYHANRGMSLTPGEVEKNIAEKLKKKQSAALPKGGSPPSGDKKYKDNKEAYNAAMKEYAGLTD